MEHGPNGSFFKPPKGTLVLEREAEQAKALKLERAEKGAAKKRDGRCRWPEVHKCRGALEAAHIRDASLGGLMDRTNLILLCAWIHRRGPESIHGKQLRIEINTPAGAEGPCSFYRRGEHGRYHLVARETRPFQLERD